MDKRFALGLIAATLVCSSSLAQEVTLRAVTAFAEKTTYSRGFEKFIERVNAEGKGLIKINYIGGPKAMPPFEVGTRSVRRGRYRQHDRAFTTNVMPNPTPGSSPSVRCRSCARMAATTIWPRSMRKR